MRSSGFSLSISNNIPARYLNFPGRVTNAACPGDIGNGYGIFVMHDYGYVSIDEFYAVHCSDFLYERKSDYDYVFPSA